MRERRRTQELEAQLAAAGERQVTLDAQLADAGKRQAALAAQLAEAGERQAILEAQLAEAQSRQAALDSQLQAQLRGRTLRTWESSIARRIWRNCVAAANGSWRPWLAGRDYRAASEAQLDEAQARNAMLEAQVARLSEQLRAAENKPAPGRCRATWKSPPSSPS